MPEIEDAGATSQLIVAISAYQAAVEDALRVFEDDFGRRDTLRACIEKAIPRRGALPSGGGYQIHGIGCWVERQGIEVDFDFGPDSRSDGFDAWRMGGYVKQFPDRFALLQNERDLKSAFGELEAEGVIHRLQNSNLFFLKEANRG